MAEYEFGIISIEPNLKEQSVFVQFNLDLDINTVNYENIYLMSLNTDLNANEGAFFDIIIQNDLLQLKLKNWAIPNNKYTLLIQPGISSVTGITLDSALIRNFVFETDVTSKIDILSPSMYEKVNGKSFTCSWKEQGDKLGNNFYLEIDTTNAFNNNPITTIVNNKNSFTTNILENGQYYLRVRSQKDNMYGYWSDTVTFLIDNNDDPNNNDNDNNEDDNDDILITDNNINIIGLPDNGITPDSFQIEFDDNINVSDLSIKIVRSDF